MPLTDQLLAVGFVICMAGAAAWALGRGRNWRCPWPARPAGRQRSLLVLERLTLTGQHALHLVQVGERTVLVGTHPSGLVLDASPESFQATLSQASRRQMQGGGAQ